MRIAREALAANPTLVIKGEIDHENIGQFVRGLQEVIDLEGPGIVLDLSGVTYLDSAGIGAIYDLLRKLNGAKEVEMTGVSSNLRRILQISGLTVLREVRVPPPDASPAHAALPTPPRSQTARPITRTRVFAGELDQLSRIRDFVKDVAREVELDKERTFNLQVAVSEAAANAIEHGKPSGDLQLSVACEDGRLTVTVSHPGSFRPRVGDEPARSLRGMGLPLMLALTDEVKINQPPRGGMEVSLSLYLDAESAA